MNYLDNFAFSLQGWPLPIPGAPKEDDEEDHDVTTTSEITTTSQTTVTDSTETTTHYIGRKKQLNIEDIINRWFKISFETILPKTLHIP